MIQHKMDIKSGDLLFIRQHDGWPTNLCYTVLKIYENMIVCFLHKSSACYYYLDRFSLQELAHKKRLTWVKLEENEC